MFRLPGSWIAASLALVATVASPADLIPKATKKLDAYFDSLQAQGLVSGSIAISERGVIRYQRSIGFATIDKGVPQPADAGTRYRIGAVTRLFTAALLLQLAERATITLDSKLAEFYPELPNALDITYRDLLQHRSGLANYTEARDFDQWRLTPKSHAEMLQVIAGGGAKFPPGDHIDDNASNYLLLGYVLEKIHERPYADIVARQISSKLALVRTYCAGSGSSTSLESISYRWTPDGWRPETNPDPSIDGGAGGMISNATDLVTFMDALFAGRVVSPDNVASMRGEDGAPGFGLQAVEIAGAAGFGARGAIDSFNAAVFHFPDRRLSISWTSNASRMPMEDILGEVVSIALGEARKAPR